MVLRNFFAPAFNSSNYSTVIPETTPIGQALMTIRATDRDAKVDEILTYLILFSVLLIHSLVIVIVNS